MKPNNLTTLTRLKRGDSSAYKELFKTYYKPLCIHALKYTDSFELSEDIVQEFFIKFWNEKLYMKLNDPIAPYLYSSIKNNSLQVLRQSNRYYFEEIDNSVNIIVSQENFEDSNIDRTKEKLHKEIEALPVKCREVFRSIALGNQKYKEVANELGVSVNTVKTHYSRALKQLRSSLATFLS